MENRSSLPHNEVSQETTQENALRAIFQHYAATSVDTAQAWTKVIYRLPSIHKQSRPPEMATTLPFWHTGKPVRRRRLSGLSLAATVALVAVLVAGAGVAVGATTGWGNMLQEFLTSLSQPVSANQFQYIGQQQQSQGVTITVEDAYADSQRTIISTLLQLPADMVKKDSFALPQTFDLVVNGQKETLISHNGECVLNFDGQHSEYCVWVLTPVHVAPDTKQLDVTWDFTTINLKSWKPLNTYHPFSAHWHFHFTLPFHRQARNPGQPPTPAHR